MEIYTVKVAVKPYTKAYLENNYGNPADIRQDPELNDMVTMMLREGSTRLDKIISSNFPATVELRITKDTFFRYGFTLTKTETLKLNSLKKESSFWPVFTSHTIKAWAIRLRNVSGIFRKLSASRKTSGDMIPLKKISTGTVPWYKNG